jgi:hypothetical protein
LQFLNERPAATGQGLAEIRPGQELADLALVYPRWTAVKACTSGPRRRCWIPMPHGHGQDAFHAESAAAGRVSDWRADADAAGNNKISLIATR